MQDQRCKCGLIHKGARYTKRGIVYDSISREELGKHFNGMKTTESKNAVKRKKELKSMAEELSQPKVDIYFYLDDKRHAYRYWVHIPRKGDLIRLNCGLYRILEVIWITHNDSKEHVSIAIEPIAP